MFVDFFDQLFTSAPKNFNPFLPSEQLCLFGHSKRWALFWFNHSMVVLKCFIDSALEVPLRLDISAATQHYYTLPGQINLKINTFKYFGQSCIFMSTTTSRLQCFHRALWSLLSKKFKWMEANPGKELHRHDLLIWAFPERYYFKLNWIFHLPLSCFYLYSNVFGH